MARHMSSSAGKTVMAGARRAVAAAAAAAVGVVGREAGATRAADMGKAPFSYASAALSASESLEPLISEPLTLEPLTSRASWTEGEKENGGRRRFDKLPEGVRLPARAQLVFLGLPGVGKGTYASRLAKFLGVPHIAMGDLVREEMKTETSLAKEMEVTIRKGQLLSDDVVMGLLGRRLEHGMRVGERGFILDGFPRKNSQAEMLSNIANLDLVLNLRLREDVLVTKCLGRRVCSECGGNYNLANIDIESDRSDSERIVMPPLLPPAECSDKMTQRIDDSEEIIRARLKVHKDECKPVEDYYRSKGILLDFDVLGGIPQTWPHLLETLHLDGVVGEESRAAA